MFHYHILRIRNNNLHLNVNLIKYERTILKKFKMENIIYKYNFEKGALDKDISLLIENDNQIVFQSLSMTERLHSF